MGGVLRHLVGRMSDVLWVRWAMIRCRFSISQQATIVTRHTQP
jgi:hypothetical protein